VEIIEEEIGNSYMLTYFEKGIKIFIYVKAVEWRCQFWCCVQCNLSLQQAANHPGLDRQYTGSSNGEVLSEECMLDWTLVTQKCIDWWLYFYLVKRQVLKCPIFSTVDVHPQNKIIVLDLLYSNSHQPTHQGGERRFASAEKWVDTHA
jgi:hypothetical protein